MARAASLFDLQIPPAQIAQHPLAERDRSRLMVVRRGAPGFSHHRFDELPALLPPGCLLVRNNTRVFPARLEGQLPRGRALEALLTEEAAPGRWRAMVKGARKVKPGDRLSFAGGAIAAEAVERSSAGTWLLDFDEPGTLRERLHRHGLAPLPPYVKRNGNAALHRDWYQTCYAVVEGSIAAPTAGFHFTPAIFEGLRARGIEWVELTLHVGVGTFLPIENQDLGRHHMHRERFMLPPETCQAVRAARERGRPVIAVGTTTVRALETWAQQGLPEGGYEGWTELFIRPPYAFRAVDGLITNFHQPASTLIWLVAALHGEERVLAAYEEAIAREYRFFSYGDAMCILPGS